jgi:tetratricopeptide (TPR) repeat protein
MQRENFDRAEVVLRTLANNESRIPEEYYPYYKAVTAEYYLLNDDIPRAIINLEQAVEFEKKKEVQTRWMFVLAQLYGEQGESIRANNTYKEIVKKHPDYEMEFWAQMNRALSYSSEDGSSFDIKRVLLKMLRDDKNTEYRDKLYYALSQLYRQEGEPEKQIRALKLSAKVSVSDDYQKGLSFLTLGQIYFSRPEYKPAQAYYDSAVTYLPEEYPNYDRIVNIKNSLQDLVDQIIIIETQDSLQKLAALPEEELMAFIEDVIDQKIAEEERKRAEAAGGAGTTTGSGNTLPGFDNGPGKGKWYFYNERNLSIGMQEFKNTWGSRANEDNWRRSDKSSAGDWGDDGGGTGTDSTLAGIRDVDSYLKDIPRSDEEIQASNQKMIEAYYALGNIYRENMDDNPHAIGSFRTLVSRFDTSKYHLTSYYILYRLYLDEGNIDSSNYFKRIVLYKYPESDYAKIIQDPSYAERMDKEKRAVENYYKKAFYYYNSGYYKACIEKSDDALKKYPDSYLSTKFKYLKALSAGAQGTKKDLINSLSMFASGHSGTPEAKDAENRIKLLTEERKVVKTEPPPKYQFERNARHLCILLVPMNGNDINEIKTSMSNYNKAYHVGKNLSISSVLLDKQTHMVSIKQFENEAAAVKYHREFLSNRTSIKKINEAEFQFFVISYTNYALFYQDKRVEPYEEFMRENYQL